MLDASAIFGKTALGIAYSEVLHLPSPGSDPLDWNANILIDLQTIRRELGLAPTCRLSQFLLTTIVANGSTASCPQMLFA